MYAIRRGEPCPVLRSCASWWIFLPRLTHHRHWPWKPFASTLNPSQRWSNRRRRESLCIQGRHTRQTLSYVELNSGYVELNITRGLCAWGMRTRATPCRPEWLQEKIRRHHHQGQRQTPVPRPLLKRAAAEGRAAPSRGGHPGRPDRHRDRRVGLLLLRMLAVP